MNRIRSSKLHRALSLIAMMALVLALVMQVFYFSPVSSFAYPGGGEGDHTAPTTSASVSPSANASGWIGSSVSVTLSANDNNGGSGVDHTYYKLDSGSQQTYSSAISVTSDGSHTVYYWSVDKSNNTETQKSTTFKIDNTDPSTTATINPSDWTKGSVSVSLSASDGSGSGVDHTYYKLDSGSQQTYSSSFNVTAEGTHTLNYWSVDKAGNSESEKSASIKIDKTAPATSASGLPTDWTKNDVSVTLTPSDGSGSGVDHTYYKLDNGTQQTYSSAFSITASGTHTLKYWSVDKVGNAESENSATIKIDKTAPESSASGLPQNWTKNNASVTLSASDTGGSGLDHIYYKLDNGSQQTYSSAISLNSDATHTLYYWSVDKAGNVESENSATIKIDKTAPDTSASGVPGDWTKNNVSVTLSASDTDGSGVEHTYYKLDNGSQQTYSSAISITTSGTHTLKYWSVDKVGNAESENSATIKIDKTAPDTSASGVPGNWTKDNVSVTLSASDTNGSGVAHTYYKLDNSSQQTYSSAISITDSGTHTLKYWSVDNAGNIESENSATIKIDRIAPTSSANFDPDGWTNGNVKVTLSASDTGGAGVAHIYYKLDDENWSTYGGHNHEHDHDNISVSGEGHTLYFYSEDEAGNKESEHSVAIKIDKTNPSLSYTFSPASPDGSNGWYKSDVTVKWTCSDSVSGVNGDCPADQTIDTEGSDQGFSQTVYDNAGNSKSVTTDGIKLDKTAPVTGASGVPEGWSKDSVDVTLSATDGTSGVDKTYYTLDGGSEQTYASKISITTNGTHTLKFYSVDKAGNIETEQTVTIKVDKTVPSITAEATTQPNANGWYLGNVTVKWTCTDSDSGLSETACPSDTTVTGEGSSLTATSDTFKDIAGNESTGTLGNIKIDRTAPKTSANLPQANANGWYSSSVNITLGATDNLSGVDKTWYKFDGDDYSLYTGALVFETNGTHSLSFYSVDKAGNEEASGNVTIKLNNGKPSIKGVPDRAPDGMSGNVAWYRNQVIVHWICTDEISGIASCPEDTLIDTERTDNVVTGTAINNAGLSATASVKLNLDKTAPIVSINGVEENTTYSIGSVPAFSCAATDNLSGVQGNCKVEYLYGGSPNQVGSITIRAVASDVAGNNARIDAHFKIVYDFGSFVEASGLPGRYDENRVPVYKAGGILTVKFQVRKTDGTVVPVRYTSKEVNGVQQPIVEWMVPVKGGSVTQGSGHSVTWDEGAQVLVYDWNTTKDMVGYWQVGIKMDDGQIFTMTLGLE